MPYILFDSFWICCFNALWRDLVLIYKSKLPTVSWKAICLSLCMASILYWNGIGITLTPFDNSTAQTREVNQGKKGQPTRLLALLSNQVAIEQASSFAERKLPWRTGLCGIRNICSSVAFTAFYVLPVFSCILRDVFLGIKKNKYGL